ncbi:cytochrome c biogenesis protein CcsA [Aestuariirhabdus sp. Z084]|uniref:cytochrome C assembly family protein n=1 Tax=Aestuariirhabdus haliotis TaxID=2918751 RepID=UPI00201B3A51|nr:cytochrome c biogenesis protein CcsA [Aestuariirhabdus haliotis]MCL6415864.1 cytochrome c biogenesis protein CcsA [Aestuariirhabdus haliotis]MCL6419834.1 cytochrome c biogenesis protein CcsA [Aestuariirhabdus haliotis]
MNIIIPSIIAITLYLAATVYQVPALLRARPVNKSLLQLLALGGATAQTFSIYFTLHTPAGINLSFFNVGSLVSWAIVLVVLLSSLKKPVESLFAGLIPVAALCVMLAATGATPEAILNNTQAPTIIHILLSITAYSLLTIATVQALLLAYQEHRIKTKHPRGLGRIFPPLQTMDILLFEFIWVGMILLTLSLVTGIIYIDNMFAQQLTHKTLLSLVAWVVYAVLLWGRHQRGWRGLTAARWTLAGFALLMLSYFGSKFVLDLLLQ